jgi:hypothetical protein
VAGSSNSASGARTSVAMLSVRLCVPIAIALLQPRL